MKRAKMFIEYKYPERPWTLYDETMDREWAQLQFQRVKIDHPGADYRVRMEEKKK
jgi:hypothetical protein